jgi:hypothetical protein
MTKELNGNDATPETTQRHKYFIHLCTHGMTAACDQLHVE